MSKAIPQMFQNMCNRGYVKAAFISDIQATNPYDCINCGGVGKLYLFVAAEGPYQSPSGNLGKISKWFDSAWWIGENYVDICPVCKGSGKTPEYKDAKPIPIALVRDGMADVMAGFDKREQLRKQRREQRGGG